MTWIHPAGENDTRAFIYVMCQRRLDYENKVLYFLFSRPTVDVWLGLSLRFPWVGSFRLLDSQRSAVPPSWTGLAETKAYPHYKQSCLPVDEWDPLLVEIEANKGWDHRKCDFRPGMVVRGIFHEQNFPEPLACTKCIEDNPSPLVLQLFLVEKRNTNLSRTSILSSVQTLASLYGKLSI